MIRRHLSRERHMQTRLLPLLACRSTTTAATRSLLASYSLASSTVLVPYFRSYEPLISVAHGQRCAFAAMSSATSFYEFKPLDKRGQEVPFSAYKGKVVLIVNTASKCGFTPQYAGLESLYKTIKEKHPDDFVILGFPCNQFGSQEPGTDDDIQNFCQVNYGVSFPIMKKIDVNGDNASPLYEWLKEEKPGLMGLRRVKWNFEKFLIGRDGKVKGRWASTTKPETLEKTILEELNRKSPEAKV